MNRGSSEITHYTPVNILKVCRPTDSTSRSAGIGWEPHHGNMGSFCGRTWGYSVGLVGSLSGTRVGSLGGSHMVLYKLHVVMQLAARELTISPARIIDDIRLRTGRKV